jgi:hypothetical protein
MKTLVTRENGLNLPLLLSTAKTAADNLLNMASQDQDVDSFHALEALMGPQMAQLSKLQGYQRALAEQQEKFLARELGIVKEETEISPNELASLASLVDGVRNAPTSHGIDASSSSSSSSTMTALDSVPSNSYIVERPASPASLALDRIKKLIGKPCDTSKNIGEEVVPLSLLPSFAFLNLESQKSLLRQLISRIENMDDEMRMKAADEGAYPNHDDLGGPSSDSVRLLLASLAVNTDDHNDALSKACAVVVQAVTGTQSPSNI